MSLYTEEVKKIRDSIKPHPDVDYSMFQIENLEQSLNGPVWYYSESDETQANRYAYFKQFCSDFIDKRGGPQQFLTADKFYIAGQRDVSGNKIRLEGKYERHYAQTSTAAQLWRRHVQLPMLLFTLSAYDGLEDGYDWVYEQIIQGRPYMEIAQILGMRSITFMDWVMSNLDPHKLAAAKEARTEYQIQKATRSVDLILDSDLSSDASLMREELRSKMVANVTTMIKYTSTARHVDFKPKTNNMTADIGSISINFTPHG